MPNTFLQPALRPLLRNKTASLIHILGLSTGLAACLLIYGYVHNELTYDAWNKGSDRIVRITTTVHAPESDLHFATSPTPLAPILVKDIPGLAAAARIETADVVIRQGTEPGKPVGFCFSEPAIFSVFTFTFLQGSPAAALASPGSIVLTRSMEQRYFGHDPAFGRTLVINDKPWRVTGVIADRPANADLLITALLSKDYSSARGWLDDMDIYTFVLFRDIPRLPQFAAQLPAIGKYARAELDSSGATGYSISYEAEMLRDVHFSQGKLIDTPKGNRAFNTIFSWLAALILVLALLNYINLSTARATERAKEVGVRKTIGARPWQLVRKFLGESFLLLALAWILAIALVGVFIPLINRLLSIHLSLADTPTILFLVGFFPLTGLLAGLYPAFVLARFNPLEALKGQPARNQGIGLRKVLTVAQFAIALAMLTATGVIYSQMQYIRHKDLGIDRTGIAALSLPHDSAQRRADTAFCDALRHESGIHGISVGSGIPIEGVAMGTTISFANGKKRELMCNYFYIDPPFLNLLHLTLVAGRNLSDSLATDRDAGFLVNEALAKEMGWKTPLGMPMEGFGHKGKVVGVVKDFFYKSIHNSVEPAVLIYNTFPLTTAMVRISPEELPRIRRLWMDYFPGSPFSYYFMDENFDTQYAKDRLTLSLFNTFTGLAIFICLIGLYGLVALIVRQRTREIGIRKVLGASLSHLLTLLTSPLLLLVGLAAVIALPLAAFAGSRWLATYAYHTRMSVGIFGWPVLILLVLTLLVAATGILRSALANPVESLRSE